MSTALPKPSLGRNESKEQRKHAANDVLTELTGSYRQHWDRENRKSCVSESATAVVSTESCTALLTPPMDTAWSSHSSRAGTQQGTQSALSSSDVKWDSDIQQECG